MHVRGYRKSNVDRRLGIAQVLSYTDHDSNPYAGSSKILPHQADASRTLQSNVACWGLDSETLACVPSLHSLVCLSVCLSFARSLDTILLSWKRIFIHFYNTSALSPHTHTGEQTDRQARTNRRKGLQTGINTHKRTYIL